ncbi:hypothetical protein TNCT_551081 [Trichonephila clavata]|uniref:Uncharacterized protein n=1 Tax=Trichonephila clavata TaxID=2740835 RepID=A0A8X6F3A6_TRICU|nr:hypothetical protein TNCT_551081 [Trichonephila clavata]
MFNKKIPKEAHKDEKQSLQEELTKIKMRSSLFVLTLVLLASQCLMPTEAMHHLMGGGGGGGGGVLEILAAGLIAKLLSEHYHHHEEHHHIPIPIHHHGRKRRSVDSIPYRFN